MPKRLKLNLSYNDLNKMSLTDLKNYAIKLNNVANLRVRKLRQFAPYSPALLSYEKSELGTFRIGKEADINSLRRSVARAKHFLDMETSTVQGAQDVTTRTLKALGIDLEKRKGIKEPKPRGRPKGSKTNKERVQKKKENKDKPRRRGRPKGSRNKTTIAKEYRDWLYAQRDLLKDFFTVYNHWKEIQTVFPGEPPSQVLRQAIEVYSKIKKLNVDLKYMSLEEYMISELNRLTDEFQQAIYDKYKVYNLE